MADDLSKICAVIPCSSEGDVSTQASAILLAASGERYTFNLPSGTAGLTPGTYYGTPSVSTEYEDYVGYDFKPATTTYSNSSGPQFFAVNASGALSSLASQTVTLYCLNVSFISEDEGATYSYSNIGQATFNANGVLTSIKFHGYTCYEDAYNAKTCELYVKIGNVYSPIMTTSSSSLSISINGSNVSGYCCPHSVALGYKTLTVSPNGTGTRVSASIRNLKRLRINYNTKKVETTSGSMHPVLTVN